jgi:hypothetical protein
MLAVGDVVLRQGRDRHRNLALAVDLRETRAEAFNRLERVGDVHRRAAPNDRPDVIGIAFRAALDQPLHHGRRGEH